MSQAEQEEQGRPRHRRKANGDATGGSRTDGGRLLEDGRTKAGQTLDCWRAAGGDCISQFSVGDCDDDCAPVPMLRQSRLFCPALRARVTGGGAKSLT